MSAVTPGTLASLTAGESANSEALLCPDDGTSLTRSELTGIVESLAAQFEELGVARGDRVALVMGNGPEIVAVLLALWAVGAAAAPLNPAYTAAEFRFYLDDIRPELLLVSQGSCPPAREAARGRVDIVDVVLHDARPALASNGSVRQFERAEKVAPGPDDVALLLHTSGTTSRPKLVELLQRNVNNTAQTIAMHYHLDENDRSYCAMPLFHVHGLLASVAAALLSGGSVVVPRRISRHAVLRQLRICGATWMSASPTLYHMLLEAETGVDPAPQLRFLRSCSAALAPDLMTRVEAAFGVPLLEAYGMTEAAHEISANPLPPDERRPGSVGRATGAEVRIVDDRWQDVPTGSVGEVVIRGPSVTAGYVENEAANAASFRDGWFRTGDLGALDEEGYVWLRGRRKEIIVRGGENISPSEVERALLSHPSVSDAVCFALPDEKYGEVVGAAVVLREEQSYAELAHHCRDQLAAFKVPASIEVVETIPRTATGKVQRARMPELLGLAAVA